jgi:hypothetical protein
MKDGGIPLRPLLFIVSDCEAVIASNSPRAEGGSILLLCYSAPVKPTYQVVEHPDNAILR